MFMHTLLLVFFEYCVYVVEGKGRTTYYKTANTCVGDIKSNQNSRELKLCFEISNIEFAKGFSIKTIEIEIQEDSLSTNPKLLKHSLELRQRNRTDVLSHAFHSVEITFNREYQPDIKLIRSLPPACFVEENCTVEISYLISNHFNVETIRNFTNGILKIQMQEVECDFDNSCTMFEEPQFNASMCNKYCNILPNVKQSITGKYGYISPSLTNKPTRLTSRVIFRSGYGCTFQYSVWIRPNIQVNISLHTPTTWAIIDTQDFVSYTKVWQDVNVSIGKIDEPFYITVDVYSPYYAAFDNFRLENCDNDDEPAPCSDNGQMRCSTGKCVQDEHVCDLYGDCFYSDDEADSLCGNSSVFSRCDFDNSNCGWQTYDPDTDCRWSLADLGDTSENHKSNGRSWYLNKTTCIQNSAGDIVIPLLTQDNSTQKLCKMRLIYIIRGKASVFIEQCTTKLCTTLHTFKSDHRQTTWKRGSVSIPIIEGRFKLYIVGQFSHEDDDIHDSITVDNISFSGDCFVYDDFNMTTIEMKPNRFDGLVQHSNNERIPWIISTVLGTFTGCLMVVLVFTVCKRKGDKTKHSTYRKISTNSTTSSVLFGIRKHDSIEDCCDTDCVKPFLGSSGISSVSPLYDWSQVNDVINIIPRNKVTVQRLIGKGAFGEVYYGLLADVPRQQKALPVAIKMLPTLCSEQSKSEFFLEAVLLSKLRHPNIVRFLGISVDEKSMYLLLELMEGGDLKTFVRECRLNDEVPSIVTIHDLLKLCIDVANGCEYLEQNRFIHRDIAARNCLLSEKGPTRVAKIADFGMTKNVFRTNYYRKNGMAMVPVKWMPPEAFHDGVFTTKTDVWGFGIVLWEVLTLGRAPYPGKSNNEVMTFVAKGGRLEKPELCSNEIYMLMCKCWEDKPSDRPDFKYIMEELVQIQKRSMFCEENVIYEEVESLNCEMEDPTTYPKE